MHEAYKVLGIEAARSIIIQEMLSVMKSHGIAIDMRHLMCLADLMTCTGKILGNQRHGLYTYKQRQLMLASFERTGETLFEAAYHNQKDEIRGPSECILMGIPMKIGTGLFQLLSQSNERDKFDQPGNTEDYAIQNKNV